MSFDMFVEKAINEYAGNGVVDNISRATPVVATMAAKQTNKGRENVYEIYTDTDTIPQTELDAPLQNVSADSALGRQGLLHWSAKQEIGIGALNELGVSKETHFASKAPRVFQKTAMNFESSLLSTIQSTAVANHKKTGTIFTGNRVYDAGGTTANKQYSIQIVTWDGDLTTGLYDTASFGGIRQGMFETALAYDGARYFTSGNAEASKNGIEVYGATYRMDAGIQLANAQNVTSIVNIEDTGSSLVADLRSGALDYNLSLMLEDADPASGVPYIYMRPELQIAFGVAFKDSVNTTSFKVGDYDMQIMTWNGIPIISTRNMLRGTQPVVTGL